MFFIGMGSWGSGEEVCYAHLPEGDHVELACARGYINKIKLAYGNPTGYCSCPAEQRPNSAGECPSRFEYGPSSTTAGESCCSKTNVDGLALLADLSAVNMAPNPTCTSYVESYIAQGLCIGETSCHLNVTNAYQFTWENDLDCDMNTPAKEGVVCSRSFMHSGNFSQCADSCAMNNDGSWTCDTYDKMEMSVEVHCQETTFSGLGREFVSQLVASIDALSMFFFWAMVVWLGKKQDDAVDAFDAKTCTAEDYTIEICGLPAGLPTIRLKAPLEETDNPIHPASPTGKGVEMKTMGPSERGPIDTGRRDPHRELEENLRAHFSRVLRSLPKVGAELSDGDVVADVNLVYSNIVKLHALEKRGDLARKIERELARINIHKLFAKEEGSDRSVEGTRAVEGARAQHPMCSLIYADCRLSAAGCPPPATHCRLPAARCPLSAADCRLPTARYPLLAPLHTNSGTLRRWRRSWRKSRRSSRKFRKLSTTSKTRST